MTSGWISCPLLSDVVSKIQRYCVFSRWMYKKAEADGWWKNDEEKPPGHFSVRGSQLPLLCSSLYHIFALLAAIPSNFSILLVVVRFQESFRIEAAKFISSQAG